MGWIDSPQRDLANAMSFGFFLLTDVAQGSGRWREIGGAEHSTGLVVGFGQPSCVSRFGVASTSRTLRALVGVTRRTPSRSPPVRLPRAYREVVTAAAGSRTPVARGWRWARAVTIWRVAGWSRTSPREARTACGSASSAGHPHRPRPAVAPAAGPRHRRRRRRRQGPCRSLAALDRREPGQRVRRQPPAAASGLPPHGQGPTETGAHAEGLGTVRQGPAPRGTYAPRGGAAARHRPAPPHQTPGPTLRHRGHRRLARGRDDPLRSRHHRRPRPQGAAKSRPEPRDPRLGPRRTPPPDHLQDFLVRLTHRGPGPHVAAQQADPQEP